MPSPQSSPDNAPRTPSSSTATAEPFVTPEQTVSQPCAPPAHPKKNPLRPALSSPALAPRLPALVAPPQPAAPTPRPRRRMGDQIYFSGDKRAPGELSAVNFVRRLEIQFRANNVVADADKIEEALLRFKADSPVDAWWAEIQADTARRIQVATWPTFLTAFNDRFRGVQSVSKPLGRRLADLERMRMDMDGLALGMVLVGDKKITPIADFVDRLKDAIKEAGAGPGISGLWQFYEALPTFIQEVGGGVVLADWDAMAAALAAVPQGRIDIAVRAHVKEKAATEAITTAECAHQQRTAAAERRVEDLQRKLAAIELGVSRVAPATAAQFPCAPAANASTQNAPAPVPAPAQDACAPAAAAPNRPARRVRAGTDAQKTRLLETLREAIQRRHPATAEGIARFRAEVAGWESRYASLSDDDLQLWVRGHPLTPGIAAPCSGECWRCGVPTHPPHPKTPEGCGCPALPEGERALAGTWLGVRALEPVGVNTVEVEEARPWWEGNDAGFGDGLQP
ncbi:hypothetical protein C8J57DRAFT_1231890 [Mycena rebaudengoi]|nr:hypothetical protein C8J57DRAFT_1231890 [Mycena rebaudengoi]